MRLLLLKGGLTALPTSFCPMRIQEACDEEEGLHLAMLTPSPQLTASRTLRNKRSLLTNPLVHGLWLEQSKWTKTPSKL